jgi:hypothetical protein
MKLSIILMLIFLFLSSNILYSDVNSKGIDWELDSVRQDYGQKPPGLIPIHFSPDFIKTKHRIHSSPTFSPDMNEAYWSVFPRTSEISHKGETILFSKKVNNIWTAPKVATFSGKYYDGGPTFSQDGKKLYFYSKRPLDKKLKSETEGEIWFVEKSGENWGEPKHIKFDFDGEKLFFSVSENNNIYFTSGHGFRGVGSGSVDLYCAKFINGTYAKPERLPNAINSKQYIESDPLISPDEKYLIFFSLERPENIGQYDLYISYNLGGNRWTKPANLGTKVNKGVTRFPRFSPDGKYLFFVRGVDGVFWMDSSFINKDKN